MKPLMKKALVNGGVITCGILIGLRIAAGAHWAEVFLGILVCSLGSLIS
jgi:hypothetical protein